MYMYTQTYAIHMLVICLFYFVWIGSFYVAFAVLELTVYTRQALKLKHCDILISNLTGHFSFHLVLRQILFCFAWCTVHSRQAGFPVSE